MWTLTLTFICERRSPLRIVCILLLCDYQKSRMYLGSVYEWHVDCDLRSKLIFVSVNFRPTDRPTYHGHPGYQHQGWRPFRLRLLSKKWTSQALRSRRPSQKDLRRRFAWTCIWKVASAGDARETVAYEWHSQTLRLRLSSQNEFRRRFALCYRRKCIRHAFLCSKKRFRRRFARDYLRKIASAGASVKTVVENGFGRRFVWDRRFPLRLVGVLLRIYRIFAENLSIARVGTYWDAWLLEDTVQ